MTIEWSQQPFAVFLIAWYTTAIVLWHTAPLPITHLLIRLISDQLLRGFEFEFRLLTFSPGRSSSALFAIFLYLPDSAKLMLMSLISNVWEFTLELRSTLHLQHTNEATLDFWNSWKHFGTRKAISDLKWSDIISFSPGNELYIRQCFSRTWEVKCSLSLELPRSSVS